jgi:hypothetical protein
VLIYSKIINRIEKANPVFRRCLPDTYSIRHALSRWNNMLAKLIVEAVSTPVTKKSAVLPSSVVLPHVERIF